MWNWMVPSGLNQDFSFSWITHLFAYSRRRALPRPALALVCNRARELISQTFLKVYSLYIINSKYFVFSDWLQSPGQFLITNWRLPYLEEMRVIYHRFDGINYDIASINLVSRGGSLAVYSLVN